MTTVGEDKEFGSYFLDRIIEWIVSNLNPEDVFDSGELRKWAFDNGFEETEVDYRYILGGR